MAATSRHGTPVDTVALIATLVEAFRSDPFWAYFAPDPDRPGFAREPAMRDVMTAEVGSYLSTGHTYLIDDRAAALWAPPGIRADDGALVEAFGRHVDPALSEAAFPQFMEMEAWRPDDPHFYLHLIGARDRARGQGLGTILLRRVLDICDTEGIPAYLEASTARSAALYARHGFTELSTVDFAPGVALRPMLRAPGLALRMATSVSAIPDAGPPTLDRIRRVPKVVLHDHLDGGLRPETIIEIADQIGYRGLPAHDPAELTTWMQRGANRKDLTLYLETFAHTVAVMQTREGIERVARECAEDLAADGVIYAEVRFAPELHTEQGLGLDDAVEAVLAGFAAGAAGTELTIRTICSAMRHQHNSLEVAQTAVRWRDQGVVGFDIAGPEDGFPPDDHLLAFQYCHRENFHITIHAGEAYGPRSIWKALQYCGAERLGHGIRIIEDITRADDGERKLGRLAHYVRDRRIPLEVCPTSNVNTGVVDRIADHPIAELIDLRFRVTLNTDNRLMSGVSMSSEMMALVDAFDYGWERLRWLTVNAMKSSFLPFRERLQIIEQVIKPRYAPLEAWVLEPLV